MQLNITRIQLINALFLSVFAIFSCSTIDAQINVLWEARYTSAGLNADVGKELAIDASGNVYVTGTSYTNGANGFDIVTIKYDALGNQLWTSVFNGSASALDEARDIAVDASGNVYVTGYTASSGPNYDYVTIKYNSTGVQQWATLYNGTGNGFDEAYALAIDNLGNTYVTGSSNASGQGSNFVTIQYNSAGVQQWATSYNGPGNSLDAATQIKLDASFNVYVSGHSLGSGTDLDIATIKYNNSGTQQWVSRYNGVLSFFDVPEALFVDNANNVYVAGATYGGIATENDYVTIKYNSTGAQQWAINYDGPLNDEDKAFDLLTDQNQNVYVTGRSMGAGGTAENIVTMKYDPLGNLLWQDTYNGPSSGYDAGQQMRLGSSGDLYITGYSAGNGTNNDYLTLKYDTGNGGILWEARFDGPSSNNDQAFAMEIDASESIYVTGSSNSATSSQDFSTIKWCQLTTNGGNDVEICIGDTIQLNASASGGIGYLWTPATGLSDNFVANPFAFPVVTTTYIVSATNALGCTDFDTVVVTVNPLPLSTITSSGPTTFCMGDSTTLTATNLGSYNWLPGGDTTQSITVFNSGNYTVDIVDSNLCNNTGTQVVTVNSLPNINAGFDINVCNGDSIQLTATGGITYTWNTQSTLTDSTISSPLAFPSVLTNYWVVGEDANGCKKTDTIIVAVSISPFADMSNSSPNDTLDLDNPNGGDIQFFSTLSTNAVGFVWDFGDGGSDNAPNPIYTYTGPGVYTVMLIASNGGCTDTVYTTITVIQAISIQENIISSLVNVFPNPADNIINITLDKDITKTVGIKIYNSIGEVMKKSISYGKTSLTIDTHMLANGIYIIQLEIDNEIITKRFTVSH
ncbi:MAG: SBBP repeat-containing protein [Flavobacteriales bacterium]|nr:SBBP repeat-containing protein [Flavobacteriales bacterium]